MSRHLPNRDSAQNTQPNLRLVSNGGGPASIVQVGQYLAARLRRGEPIQVRSKIFTRQAAVAACLEDPAFVQSLATFLSSNQALFRAQSAQTLQRIFDQRLEAQALTAALAESEQEDAPA